MVIKEVGVTTSKSKAGSFRIFFDRKDVRKACRMMVCAENCESCINLMEQNAMTCELCYSVLVALKKRPATIKPILN